MQKYTIEEVKKIPPEILLKLIDKAKQFLKKNDVFKDMCKEYDVEVDIIDVIPVKFGDIDVSASTNHGIITLNYKLLCDGNFFKDYMYLIHEAQHYLQQCYNDKPTQGADDGDYLNNPFEQEGFQRQIEYINDTMGDEKADKYVDQVLDHHDKDGKERDKLKNKLMTRVEED